MVISSNSALKNLAAWDWLRFESRSNSDISTTDSSHFHLCTDTCGSNLMLAMWTELMFPNQPWANPDLCSTAPWLKNYLPKLLRNLSVLISLSKSQSKFLHMNETPSGLFSLILRSFSEGFAAIFAWDRFSPLVVPLHLLFCITHRNFCLYIHIPQDKVWIFLPSDI